MDKDVYPRCFASNRLALEYGCAYPKSPESDWIRGIVLSLVGIWSRNGKIKFDDAITYLSYIEEGQRMTSEKRRQLNWLRDTIRKAC